MTPSTTRWANINGINFVFAKHSKPEFSSAHCTLNYCFTRVFDRDEIPHFITSLERQDTTIHQIRNIFLIGLVNITDTDDIARNFFPLDMTYTKDNQRHVLNTLDSLTTLLDHTAANAAGGYMNIDLDINPLYFKDDFNVYDPCDISFTSFNEYTMIRRHAKALKNAMADTTDRCAKEAWTFHQAAETARTQAAFVNISKVDFIMPLNQQEFVLNS